MKKYILENSGPIFFIFFFFKEEESFHAFFQKKNIRVYTWKFPCEKAMHLKLAAMLTTP